MTFAGGGIILALRLIVGLGNPGPKYAGTRHNVGEWLLTELADQHHLTLREQPKLFGRTAQLSAAQTSWLLIPSTYMNESGRAVRAVAEFYKISAEEILVAHDELDFPAGVVRLKAAGGHGGHNGLRDIIQCLGSNQFLRLRIGISHPGNRDQVLNYVLGEPSHQDYTKIKAAITDSLNIIPDLLAGDVERAFRYLHQT